MIRSADKEYAGLDGRRIVASNDEVAIGGGGPREKAEFHGASFKSVRFKSVSGPGVGVFVCLIVMIVGLRQAVRA